VQAPVVAVDLEAADTVEQMRRTEFNASNYEEPETRTLRFFY